MNMSEVDGKIIETVRNISEDLDMLSITDPDAWNNLHEELEGVIPGMPDEATECKGLAGRCLDGFRAMAEKSVSDTFTLMEALYDALSAMERRLQVDPNGDELVEKARRAIDEILPGGPEKAAPTDDVEPVEAVILPGGEGVSLNDAAALLIQIEPEDADELNQLQDVLELLVEDKSLPDAARERIADAAEMVDQICGGGAENPEAALEDVGKLIESAMAFAENPPAPDADEPPAPAAAPTPEVAPEDDSAPEEESLAAVEETPAAPAAAPGSAGEAEVEDGANYLPEDPDYEMLGEFVAEGADLIASAEEALLTLETDPDDTEAVGTVFRAFHTVKGTAAFLDLLLVSEMGHHAETLLSRVRDNEIRYCGGYADLSLRALDMIKDLINTVQDALDGSPIYKPRGYDELMKLLADPEAAGISEEMDDSPELRVGDILVAQGKATREEVEEVAAQNKNEPIGLSMVKNKKSSAKDVGQALRTQSKMSGPKRVEATVRVSTGRLDRLIDMVGELVIAHSMVAQDEVVMDGNHHDLSKRVSHTSKIVRELQDMSMSLRMVPLKATFNKMTRLVRDLGRKIGKAVNLATEGEDTEIDR
ncbi:MAG: hypothetical protein GY859_34960, partial [Desulfobacterales bacterium]|nr:hypothetical protein [Desulfobacterales bacterium]